MFHFDFLSNPRSQVLSASTEGDIIRSLFTTFGGAWYDLSDTTDATGNGNNLTDVNSPAAEEFDGRPAPCYLYVAASSQYSLRADNASISPTAGQDMSFGVWVNLQVSAPGDHNILSKGSLALGTCEYAIYWRQAVNRFRITAGDGVTPVSAEHGTAPSLATWYFIAARFVASTGMLGINVNMSGWVETPLVTMWDDTAELRLAWDTSGSGSRRLDGYVDGAYVLKTLLSDSQFLHIYNGGAGRTWSEL